ncbi:MAG TPA: NADH:flavin oxidoreductase/NADH oxidase family protein [Kofleriaceae bacterium]|jgi:2,4-dienoyl-CoA reductase-like NADH-dependent reductase (Old Yellow Enzyme family)
MQIASPLALPCGITLANRIAKSATSEALAHRETGRLDQNLVKLYERWGAGGAGLLITGNVVVHRDGRTEPGNVVLDSREDLPMLTAWATAAQAKGAHLIMQINHAGRQTPRRISSDTVGPSAIGLKGKAGLFAVPRALTDGEIRALVARFADGAAIAVEAGFAGVQVHAAHGYLISQFLSPLTNQRTDEWGGDTARRMKFLLDVVRATRSRIGPTKILSVKLNSADFQRGGFSNEDAIEVVRALETEGIDLLEISGGSYESSAMMGADSARSKAREGYFLDFAKQIRSHTKLPLMLTGGLRSAAVMNEIVGRDIDIVGMARPLIAEPDLPQRMIAGTADGAAPQLRRISMRMADDILQIAWYQRQLRRMGQGLHPHPTLGRWSSVVVGFFRNYAFNPFSVRRRRAPLALSQETR